MLNYVICLVILFVKRYHVGFIITVFLKIDQTQLIDQTNFILDVVTN